MNRLAMKLVLAGALTLPAVGLASQAGAQVAQPQDEAREQCDGHRGGGHRGERMQRRFEMMTRELNLNENQVTAVRQAFQQARSEREAMRDLPRGSAERQQAREQIKTRLKQRIDAVLTAPQRAKLEQLRQQHEQRRSDAFNRRNGI